MFSTNSFLRTFSFLCLLFILPPYAWAGGMKVGGHQKEVVLTGTILSPEGLPLPGATVALDGTGLLAVTDATGVFHLSVPAATSPVLLTAQYVGAPDKHLMLYTPAETPLIQMGPDLETAQ